MTTINNGQTTSISAAPKLENRSTVNDHISRLKSAVARFWENYLSALEKGQFYIPMP